MGCKLSIGIKGDNTTNLPDKTTAKISPIFHEQATSPILTDRKDSTTNTTPTPKKKDTGIQKDYAEKETDYKPPDSPDSITDNGTESKHSDSKNRWKSKARAIGSITGGSSVQHIDR